MLHKRTSVHVSPFLYISGICFVFKEFFSYGSYSLTLLTNLDKHSQTAAQSVTTISELTASLWPFDPTQLPKNKF